MHEDLLVSALSLTEHEYYGDLFLKAAALFRSLIKNHPFFDGNKRTAVLVLLLFLDLNGYELTCTDCELTRWALDTARSRNPSIYRIKSRIKRHSRKISVNSKELWARRCKLLDNFRRGIFREKKN